MNGVTTLYMYDPAGNLIGEYDNNGGGGTGGGTGPVFSTIEVIYWHHNDHLGTPQALTDINGTVVWTMNQTPFGIATVNEDPDGDGVLVTNNFRMPGQYYKRPSRGRTKPSD